MLKKNSLTPIVLAVALMVGLAFALAPSAAVAKNPNDYVKEKIQNCQNKSNGITMKEVRGILGKPGVVLLDCRTEKEFKKGHLPGAINIPRGKLEFLAGKKIGDVKATIITYCKKGGRACLSCCTLMEMGYTNVRRMKKGFDDWVGADYPVE